MANFIRGSNPIWSLVDLQGEQFDDTFYMWVLQNQIPYQPAIVYHDQSGQIPWDYPIKFRANGTLPIDIFWDKNTVYRLEFRKNLGLAPPSQSDPLIYLVENYDPGNGGDTPSDTAGLFSDNQITNPQFANILFSSPYNIDNVIGPISIEVSPGWFLDLTGSGDVSLERVSLNSTLPNPTNAPYALRITLSGPWSGSPILRQTFSQNGILWANKWVSCSITARNENDIPQPISARLVNSQGSPMAQVLQADVNSAFNEYRGHGFVPASINTDIPPDASIDLQILLPTNCDLYLTSIQLIESDTQLEYAYEQETVERQLDQNFHYYFNSLLSQNRSSILTGWDFSLNPYQFITSTLTTVPSQCQYIADQTILYQNSAGGTLQSGKASTANRNGLQIKALTGFTDNRFALIQYIDPSQCRPFWGYIISALARARIFTAHGTQVGIKMRLIYSTTLPNAINATNPISSWTQLNPVFDPQWEEIIPLNDPVYILQNTQGSNSEFDSFPFNKFQMPAVSTDIQVLGVVIYTTENLNSSSGTEDSIVFDQISLTPTDFACATNVKTFEQTLQECQFYYETSYSSGIIPGTPNAAGFQQIAQNWFDPGLAGQLLLTEIPLYFKNIKRINALNSNIAFYSPVTGATNNVRGFLYMGGAQVNTADIPVTNYNFIDSNSKVATYNSNTFSPFLNTPGANQNIWGGIRYHYTVDVRLGL